MAAVVLSICIPTFNRLDYVRGVVEALDSLRARLPVELVISDDASSDGTPAWLDALAARDPAVRVYHQPRLIGGLKPHPKHSAFYPRSTATTSRPPARSVSASTAPRSWSSTMRRAPS